MSVTEGLTVGLGGALGSPPGSAGVSAGVEDKLLVVAQSVSACALAPGARGGDVEEGLRLPQLGSSLQVIHVACGGVCIRACRKTLQNKAQ